MFCWRKSGESLAVRGRALSCWNKKSSYLILYRLLCLSSFLTSADSLSLLRTDPPPKKKKKRICLPPLPVEGVVDGCVVERNPRGGASRMIWVDIRVNQLLAIQKSELPDVGVSEC